MIAAGIVLGVLALALLLVLILPAGALPFDHAPDCPPLTERELEAAEDALERDEGAP